MITNEIRDKLGIKPINSNWEKIPLKGMEDGFIFISKKNKLEKFVCESSRGLFFYREDDYDLALTSQREIIGKRGKIRRISYSVLEKIKTQNKSLFINENEITLVNSDNKIKFLNIFDHRLKNSQEVIQFFQSKLKNLSSFEEELLSKFLLSKKLKRQKIKSGDIFRRHLGENKFAYGRVIADLRKLMNYEVPVSSVHNIDWKGKHIFDPILYYPVWIDYFILISDDPNLKEAKLNSIKTTPSIISNAEIITKRHFEIVDNIELDLDSFDVPMEIDTYYQYVPKCHIFKWGLGVLTFDPDEELESQRELRYPMAYNPKNYGLNQRIDYFIRSGINNQIDFRSMTHNGDIREVEFKRTRELISKGINFDIENLDYDQFAENFEFLKKSEILNYCENSN